MGDSYQTIFVLGLRSFPWSMVGGPLLFIGISLLVIKLSRSFKRKTFYFAAGIFLGSIATIIFVVLLITIIPNFLKLRNAYVSGKSEVVEGVVTDFHPAPMIGPAAESFTTDGIVFSYNAVDSSPCFQNAPLHHGPIRDGLAVRIHYNDGCIQRVDVLQSSRSPSSKP